MEMLVLLAIAFSLGLAFVAWRLRRQLNAQRLAISQRDQAFQRLRRKIRDSERQHQAREALTSLTSDLTFDIALLLDEDLRIVRANRMARPLLDHSDPVGARLSDLLEAPELLSLAQAALRESVSLEEQFVIRGGNYRARALAFERGREGRYIGIGLQDITELVSLNRARRDLVANISHELRTPITRIRLIIENLFLEADKPKRKASIQSLKEIATETDALLWLAQELLDLSMIESGEAIMRLVKTPLKPLVDEAIARFEAQAAMKELSIVSRVPPDFEALGDADQLKRALGNLLHNAIKWSPRAQTITISASERADEIMVTICDRGPGVPDGLRQRVFERFYQADASRSGGEGAGLGLAICKHIIEAHGGRVWAEGNSNGAGGQFRFTLLKADASFAEEERVAEGELAPALAAEAPPRAFD